MLIFSLVQLPVHLRHPRLAISATQPAKSRAVQHLAFRPPCQTRIGELRRRIHDVVFLADGCAGHPQLFSPPSASRSRRPWCAVSRGIRRRPSARASPITCCCQSALSLRCSLCRVGHKILNHALRHKEQRQDKADWQQQVIGDARQVHPEVADGLRRMPRDTAHQGRRDRDADGGGKKVVDGQRNHLREIRHRGFAAVALPIRVRGEADGGVKGQMLRQRAELLRVEWQISWAVLGWRR